MWLGLLHDGGLIGGGTAMALIADGVLCHIKNE